MIEATTSQNARQAMERAHQERGQIVREAWSWLFTSKGSR